MLALPVGLIALLAVRSVWSVGLSLVGTMAVTALGDVWLARSAVGMGAWFWIKSVVVPTSIVSVICLGVGIIPSFIMMPSFGRVMLTTFVTVVMFCPLVWFAALSVEERMFLRQKLSRFLSIAR